MNRSYIKNLKIYLLSHTNPLTVLSLCIEKNFHSKKVYKIILKKILTNRNNEQKPYKTNENTSNRISNINENISNTIPINTPNDIHNTIPTNISTDIHSNTPLANTLLIVSKNIENPLFLKKFPLQYTLT
ncbi:hypothetical protein CWI36_2191p0010, partial [Hamiltosporidium magnivora]